jgi:hypothetical protein
MIRNQFGNMHLERRDYQRRQELLADLVALPDATSGKIAMTWPVPF